MTFVTMEVGTLAHYTSDVINAIDLLLPHLLRTKIKNTAFIIKNFHQLFKVYVLSSLSSNMEPFILSLFYLMFFPHQDPIPLVSRVNLVSKVVCVAFL